MRTRLWAFVTFLGLVGCGASTGGGGSSLIYCGVGGTCPTGLKCSAQNFCIPAGTSSDGGFTDSTTESDVTSGGTDAAHTDSVPSVDTKTDASAPDIATTDVQFGTQTVAGIEQAATSANCTTLDAIADSASDVQLEDVVVTSPPTKLKSATGTYSTTFYVAPASGAASDGSWAGLQVVVKADPFSVNIGDTLRIKGTVTEFYCMTEIVAQSAADVTTVSTGATPQPFGVQVSVFASSSTAEPFEGDLVKITNVQIGDPNPLGTDGKTHGLATINHNGGNVSVQLAPAFGSAYLSTGTTSPTTTFTAGQAFASVTGNVQWSFGQWVIRTRSDADIVLK